MIIVLSVVFSRLQATRAVNFQSVNYGSLSSHFLCLHLPLQLFTFLSKLFLCAVEQPTTERSYCPRTLQRTQSGVDLFLSWRPRRCTVAGSV